MLFLQELFKSVSAFAPICHPSACPWGVKAFTGYLGSDQSTWVEYDATALAQHYRGPKAKVLIDQGLADQFYLDKQLLPEDLKVSDSEQRAPGLHHSHHRHRRLRPHLIWTLNSVCMSAMTTLTTLWQHSLRSIFTTPPLPCGINVMNT